MTSMSGGRTSSEGLCHKLFGITRTIQVVFVVSLVVIVVQAGVFGGMRRPPLWAFISQLFFFVMFFAMLFLWRVFQRKTSRVITRFLEDDLNIEKYVSYFEYAHSQAKGVRQQHVALSALALARARASFVKGDFDSVLNNLSQVDLTVFPRSTKFNASMQSYLLYNKTLLLQDHSKQTELKTLPPVLMEARGKKQKRLRASTLEYMMAVNNILTGTPAQLMPPPLPQGSTMTRFKKIEDHYYQALNYFLQGKVNEGVTHLHEVISLGTNSDLYFIKAAQQQLENQ